MRTTRGPFGYAVGFGPIQTTGRIDERLIAVVLFAAIAAFGVLGSVGEKGAHGFDLDAEVNFPSLFSASLLAAAGALTILAGRALATGRRRLAWGALSAGLFLLACDEFVELHEKLERAVGLDWQLLYAPLVVVLGAAFLLILRTVWPIRSTRLLLLAAAAAWFVSQILEQAQWDGERRVSAYR
ncbi:MAG: hypothetical protein ACREUZ_18200, partial [Burkholderiales bacterium]